MYKSGATELKGKGTSQNQILIQCCRRLDCSFCVLSALWVLGLIGVDKRLQGPTACLVSLTCFPASGFG